MTTIEQAHETYQAALRDQVKAERERGDAYEHLTTIQAEQINRKTRSSLSKPSRSGCTKRPWLTSARVGRECAPAFFSCSPSTCSSPPFWR